MQFTVQITKLNRLAKTYREHICSRIETLAHRLTAKKFDWENSDIKWMKIASINSIVTNTSQFHFFLVTFCEGLKLITNGLHNNFISKTFFCQ